MFLLGLQAAAWRVPFLPTRVGLGSDILRDNDRVRIVTSPFDDGEELVAVPALTMDAAFVHMNRADARGNGQYLGPDPYMDDLFLGAAERRFLSAERIVPTEDLAKEGPPQSLLISRLLVDGVIEAPNGAHFTSCDPDYPRDEAFQKQYAAAAKSPEAWAEFRAGLARPQRGRVPGPAAPRRRSPVTDQLAGLVERADVCVVAMAECFRGDGEILANPIGTIPMIGGRLARATFEPDLAMTDGEARLIANDEAFEWPERQGRRALQPVPADVRLGVERPPPRRDGRHPDRPVRQPELRRHRRLPAAEGAAARLPGRAGQHDQRHHLVLGAEPHARRCCASASTRCAASATTAPPRSASRRPGSTRSASSSPTSPCSTSTRADHRMRLRSVHPGVTVDEVQARHRLRARRARRRRPSTRLPTPDELELIDTVIDPAGLRFTEVPRG